MAYWHKLAVFQHLGAHLVDQGIAPTEVLVQHGLPATLMLNPHAWVERGTALRLARDIGRLTGSPHLGLDIAAEFAFGSCGTWGTGILEAPTLGAALAFASRNLRQIRTGAHVSITPDGDCVRVSSCFDGKLEADPFQHNLCDLFILRKLLDLTEEPVPVKISLACERPSFSDKLERAGGPDLEFGAVAYQLQFDRDALDLPLRRNIAPRSATGGVPVAAVATGRAVYASIRQAILGQRPSIVCVAQNLGLNVRMLQRQLREWGVTFEQVLDEYRRITAIKELTESGRSVTEIAFELGYSDSAHFTRAVRRWTGKPPRLIRVAHKGAPASSVASPGLPPSRSGVWQFGELDAA